jgi:hypothetical protein
VAGRQKTPIQGALQPDCRDAMTLLIVGTGRVSGLGQSSPVVCVDLEPHASAAARLAFSELDSIAIVAGVPIAALTAGICAEPACAKRHI